MNKQMSFCQLELADLICVVRELDFEHIGLLVAVLVENLLCQSGLKTLEAKQARLLGCKSKKTFLRMLERLIEKQFIVEVEDGFWAAIGLKAYQHFQEKSQRAKQANAHREVVRKKRLENEIDDKGATPNAGTDIAIGLCPATTELKCGDLPFDKLVERLKQAARSKGQPLLADALEKPDALHLVEEWCQIGVPHEQIVKTVSVAIAKKSKHKDPEIGSWNYFDKAVKSTFHKLE